MRTNEQIEAYALNEAIYEFFCNVEDDDWPEDPIACLKTDREWDQKMMLASDYEYDGAEEILERIENFVYHIKRHIEWAQDSEAVKALGAAIEQGDPQTIADEWLKIKGTLV